jgi:hypothetical protein
MSAFCIHEDILGLPAFFRNLCRGVENLTGCYDLSVGPCSGKMLEIPGYEVMGAGGLRTLQKNVVVGVGAGTDLLGRLDPKSFLPDSSKCLLDYRLAAVKLGTPHYFFVFRVDIAAYAKLRFGPSQYH